MSFRPLGDSSKAAAAIPWDCAGCRRRGNNESSKRKLDGLANTVLDPQPGKIAGLEPDERTWAHCGWPLTPWRRQILC